MWEKMISYVPHWQVFFQGFLAFFIPYLIFKLFHGFLIVKKGNGKIDIKEYSDQSETVHKPIQKTLEQFTGDYSEDLLQMRKELGHNWDIHFREFHIGNTGNRAAIVFLKGLCDKELIDKHILKSLMNGLSENSTLIRGYELQQLIANEILPVSDLIDESNVMNSVGKVLTGSTVLIVDGIPSVFIIGTAHGKTRNLEEPVSEALVRGPRVGFTEKLSVNTSLLRQHGENQHLSIIEMEVGERIKKQLVLAYIDEIVEPDLVKEVRKRIESISLDDVAESGYIEQLIEDNYLSPFTQVQSTERPDRVVAALLEGRVAILLDGTPFALIVPVAFNMLLQSPEDYYERWLPSSLIRLLRYFAAGITLFGPSLYIAFVSFHQGLIPTKLALSMMGTRQGVPFPALIEALIMEVAIEILREAGLRLPKPIGPTMGIVGGLVIGEAAVQAGIVSPIMVIVVALTAISSFAIPQYNAGITLRMLRFVSMFSAALFGLYGIILFFLFLCSHLVKLKSFGVPYLSPTVPYRAGDWKDFMVRMPFRIMKHRPRLLKPKDSVRKGE
ncbi:MULTISPECIES: spore germination protein [Lysinibacillus]|uniref:Spore germination protein n=1 Tax=Lysinibacillus fusiformis TaxID=28031 RepID=A0A2I0V1N9_9BACI|nr:MULTISPECIES: spore germination protein [Lysinibacillus]PKU52217.1 spore germination protein [Lysinibacillus fusiformis]SCZ05633.1 spore germination protein [Lysinibacillus sp. SG9]SDB49954.1 spore germination protein [Lysinibacillus sp. TC-37]SFT09641.1 spore germination protein [Lysinibacillus sp. SG55]